MYRPQTNSTKIILKVSIQQNKSNRPIKHEAVLLERVYRCSSAKSCASHSMQLPGTAISMTSHSSFDSVTAR